ncbi:MAG: hypothetical protein IKE77_03485 [Erysipelotrichaceae bacterium]|nr:hypothetical protein [Erysipelotrichaceae bacterium]
MTIKIKVRKSIKDELNGRLLFFIDRPDSKSTERHLFRSVVLTDHLYSALLFTVYMAATK